MPAPASSDLRQRVVNAYLERRGSLREIAGDFQVDFKSVHRWVERFRQTGSVAPVTDYHHGTQPKVDAQGTTILRALVHAQPDATLQELCDLYLARTGTSVSPSLLCRLLKTLDLPRKKSRRTPASSSGPRSLSSASSSPSRKRPSRRRSSS